MNDLVTLFALPAMQSSAGSESIAHTLGDALVRMLDLDLVYARLNPSFAAQNFELVRAGARTPLTSQPGHAGAALARLLGRHPPTWPPRLRGSLAGVELSLVTLALGVQAKVGVLVVGSERPDFAEDAEFLLLKVAAQQATSALQGARLLEEQTRLARDLELSVVQRTQDLSALAAALTREIAERRRTEQALRESERELRSVLDGIPGFVAIMTAGGAVEAVNRQIIEYTGRTLEELKHWGTNGTVHAEDLPHVAAIFTSSITAGVPYEIEQRLRRFDGVYRWFNNSGVPMRDASGCVVRWYVLLTDIDEMREAQEELRAREIVSREIVDNIPIHISLLSATGQVELINRQILDYTGQTPASLAQWDMSDLVYPEDLPLARESFVTGLSAATPFEIVYRMRRFDGAYRWFEARHRPLKALDGSVVRWCVSVNDIDDRKRAEDALRESERQSRLIVDTIPAGVALLNADGEPEGANKQLLEYFGQTVEHLKHWATNGTIHPEDCPDTLRALAQAIAVGQPFDIEARYRRFDGLYRWFQARGLPLRDSAGRIVRWYTLHIDIDERKRAEGELRRSEAFLVEAQRLSSTGSFSWYLDTDELKFSNELYRIFEFDKHLPVTLDGVRARVHAEDAPLLTEKLTLARSGINDHDYNIRLQLPDGRVRHLRTVARANQHADGRLEYLGTIQDTTEHRLAEDALTKVRSELAHVTRTMSLGVLTASIAHEVSQPLSGIITNASTCLRMLAAQPPNIDGALDTARRTIRDGNRASEVITRLRALFGKKEVVTEAVDLNEATREVIALSRQDLQRRRIQLQAELADNVPSVSGDRVQLQQVILNLLLNASDSMKSVEDRPKQILIRTTLDSGGAARVTVRDSGIGVEAESLNKLFDAFYTTKADGMGIGLSVSRSIIESHQGRLWCEPNDGPGATFAFVIPITPKGTRPQEPFHE